MTKPTLSTAEAADLMHVTRQQVLDLIDAGVLNAAKLGKGYTLMTRDVLAYIEKQIAEQTAKRMRRPKLEEARALTPKPRGADRRPAGAQS
jgi:excisionase family DNA binding protein